MTVLPTTQASAALEAGAEVLRHPATCGKGAALKRGWQQARARGFDWAVTLDGDGQHAPADIPAFFRCAEQTDAALVVGNRMTEPEKMPPLRRIVNRFMSHRISRLAGKPLPDSQCGFRLMSLNAWAGLATSGAHFEVESEVLLQFARAGLRIEFVPIQVIYKTERSKIHPVLDTLRWLRWWHRAGSAGRVTRVPEQ